MILFTTASPCRNDANMICVDTYAQTKITIDFQKLNFQFTLL